MRAIVTHWSFRSLSLVLAGLMVGGCGASSLFSPGAGKRYVYTYSLVAPVTDSQLVFEDDRISVTFSIDESAVLFRLRNKTRNVIRLLWSDVVLGLDGRFMRVRHASDLYADSMQTAPFPLPPDGYVRDLIIPAPGILWNGQRWIERPLFRLVDERNDSLRTIIHGNIGRRIRLNIPIQFASGVHSYDFTFEVTRVDEIQWKDYLPVQRDPRPPVPEKNLSKNDQVVTITMVVGFLAMFALLISADKAPPSE